MDIAIHNSKTFLHGIFDPNKTKCDQINERLRVELSFMMPNVEFSPKYKTGLWDGRISLYNKREQSFPTGLVSRAIQCLKDQEIEYTIIDKRVKPEPNMNLSCAFEEHGRQLRFYQQQAVDVAIKKTRGIISMATGGGKTLMAVEMIRRVNAAPILFIVPSRELLKQTQRELSKYLRNNGEPMKIGIIGDGVYDVEAEGINVITYQTALAAFNEKYNSKENKIIYDELVKEKTRKTTSQLENEYQSTKTAYERKINNLGKTDINDKELNKVVKKEKNAMQKAKAALETRHESIKNKNNIRNLIQSTVALLIDETHLAAVIIEKIGHYANNAYYKWGLSATPYRVDNQEIRIEGTLGRIFYKISASDLIDLGYLVKPKIFMVKNKHKVDIECEEDGIVRNKTYSELYRECIVESEPRNFLIKQYAEQFHKMGRPVIILVEQLEHGRILEEMIEDSIFVPGSATSHINEEDLLPTDEELNYRRRMLNRTESNEIILIATQWANTGIDAPMISTLVLAGSNQSPITTMQQIGRILRIAPNKEDAIIIDFMDQQKYFRTHSNQRKRIYQLERNYKVNVIQ